MKKITTSIAALFFSLVFSQKKTDSLYEVKPLKIDEINFISGYYDQTGTHSAIMGGNGSEKIKDFHNALDVKLIKKSGKYEHNFDVNLTAEHHSSASTAYIDKSPEGETIIPYGIKTKRSAVSKASGNSSETHAESSASALYGWRLNPSLNWKVRNLENNTIFGLGAYYSYEFDYNSWGGEVSFVKASQDNNKEFSIKAMAFFDQRQYIIPYELRATLSYGDWRSKNSYSVNMAYSQVINQRLQISLLGDIAYQQGLLSTPYNRVYFDNYTVSNEKLPDKKLKIPIGIRANYFLGDNFIFRTYYRYYWDNWGMTAHTVNLEVPVKISPNFSISPFFRYHTQTGIKYFNEYATTSTGLDYYSSDYDLSKFNSQNLGLNLHFVPQDWGVFHDVDIRYSHYKRSDGLSGNNLTLSLTFK